MKSYPLLALALIGLAAPAIAEPAGLPRSQAVRTADLDLSSKAGQTKLSHRIRIAVNAVCGEASNIDPVGQIEVKRCRDETRLNVQTRVSAAIAAAERNVEVASVR